MERSALIDYRCSPPAPGWSDTAAKTRHPRSSERWSAIKSVRS